MGRRVAPDVPGLLIETLPGMLTGLPEEIDSLRVVGVKPHDSTDDPYVLILDTGGAGRIERMLYRSQVTVDCYGPTAWWAGEIARRVDAAIHSLPSAPGRVAQVTSPAPSEFPDLEGELPRYTCTYQILSR